MTLKEIHIYPVKGLAGFSPQRAYVERRGLRFDRRWMLVDSEGVFLSQRSQPKMATLKAVANEDCLTIAAPFSSICIDRETGGEQRLVRVWRSEVTAICEGERVDKWFGEQLGIECSLVRMPEQTLRQVNPEYGKPDDVVSFADGYPVLLATMESLADLNTRLEQPVPMNRFRPNLVVEGAPCPWAEDDWRTLVVGGISFRNAKPCSRCLVTTIDQATGIPTGTEPPIEPVRVGTTHSPSRRSRQTESWLMRAIRWVVSPVRRLRRINAASHWLTRPGPRAARAP